MMDTSLFEAVEKHEAVDGITSRSWLCLFYFGLLFDFFFANCFGWRHNKQRRAKALLIESKSRNRMNAPTQEEGQHSAR